jgi:methylenetetrahydrofolate reductase (NADPH)
MAGATDAAREGRNLCVDLIQEIRAIRGVSGVHVMAYKQEDSVAEIIQRSGVLEGRIPWYPGRDSEPNSNRPKLNRIGS